MAHHNQAQAQAGGFLHFPTPPPSSLASPSPSSLTGTQLPLPRAHALKPGSPKETAFIHYVDKGIQEVQRRVAMKRGREDGVGTDGYTGFGEVGRDLERLVEVVWVSGTPSLQIPYLLSLALLTTTYISAFPPAPRSLFRLLDKLDSAFASLLLGSDVQTGEPLPGFEGNRRKGVSGTEKVRIKSLVERTRVVVVEVFTGSAEFDETDGAATEMETETENEMGDSMYDIDERWSDGRDWEMDVARVYVRTLEELGDELVGPSIGIPDS